MNDKCVSVDQSSPVKPFVLKRTWVVLFVSFSNFLMTFLRYNLSVAIIAIQDEKMVPINDFVDSTNGTDPVEPIKRYPLDERIVCQLLAAYFYGYTFAQMPAGRLSEIFGARYVLFLGTLCSGLVSFVIPFLLDWSPIAMIVGRVLIGMSHATCLSCGYVFFTYWIPDCKQKSVAITWINVAFELGGICSFFLSGFICSSDVLGWRWCFYLFALPAFVWAVPYYFLVFSRPEDDPGLSDYERKMIESERKKANSANHELSKNENLVKVPPKLNWAIILTSGPVIASCFTKSGVALVYYIVTVKIPAYFQDVFEIPIASNGSITAGAVVAILISKFMCLKLSTVLLNLNPWSITNFRKIFQTVATLVPGLCLFLITLKSDQTLATCMVFVAMFGAGFVCLGDSASTAEFAAELSGSIFGVSNSFACLSGMFAPMIVSFCQSHFDDRVVAWNWCFYITVIFLLISILIFVLFASAEPQPWAVSKFVSVEKFEKRKQANRSEANESQAIGNQTNQNQANRKPIKSPA